MIKKLMHFIVVIAFIALLVWGFFLIADDDASLSVISLYGITETVLFIITDWLGSDRVNFIDEE